jgi:hypothetical protein
VVLTASEATSETPRTADDGSVVPKVLLQTEDDDLTFRNGR